MNILHSILTTNHDWAVPAGPNARRWFVIEVDESRTFDREYFDALYGDMNDGGYGELLHFLLNVKLGNWHPRNIHRTTELADQQVLSAGSIKQWLLSAAEEDGFTQFDQGKPIGLVELGRDYATQELYGHYCDHRRFAGGRIESDRMFGRTLKKVLGDSAHIQHVKWSKTGSRHPGYYIPDAATLRGLVMDSILGRGRQ